MDLHLSLRYDDDNNGDIIGNDLYEEIKVFCNIVCESICDWSPLEFFKKFTKQEMNFPT